MTLLNTLATELTTIQIVIGIVVSIILANLWQKFIDNFFYNTLGLEKESSYVAFVIAIGFTFAFFVFLYFVSSFVREVVLGGIAGRTRTHELLGEREPENEIDVEPRCCTKKLPECKERCLCVYTELK